MNNTIRICKKVILFLAGIVLIIWGYKVNAANIDNNKIKDATSPNEVEDSGPQKPKVKTLSKEDVNKAKNGESSSKENVKPTKKDTVKTTVEPAKAEESSGTN